MGTSLVLDKKVGDNALPQAGALISTSCAVRISSVRLWNLPAADIQEVGSWVVLYVYSNTENRTPRLP